jgi:small GTP-binding protein
VLCSSFAGCSFCTHSAPLPPSRGGSVAVQIWDTAGQEKYRSFTRQYFRGAAAALLLYDITSAASFEGAKRWIKEELQKSAEGTLLFLVGSKLDLAEERKVEAAAAQQLAESANAMHFECSSKDGTNVSEILESVAEMLVQRGLASPEGTTDARLGSSTPTRASTVNVMPLSWNPGSACSC